ASILPSDAELGRLGDDRFGVLLPRASRSEAEGVAHRIRSFLHADIDANVGVATSQVRALSADDLLRVAEAALGLCKREGVGLQVLVGGSTLHPPRPQAGASRAPLRYAQIRSSGHVPRAVTPLALYGWISTVSLLVVGACGSVVVAAAWLAGGDGLAHDVVRYGGPLWIVWVAALAILSRQPLFTRPGFPGWSLLASSTAAVTIGISCAALADEGLVAPLAGAFFVKTLFDAATLPELPARWNFAGMMLGWAGFAALSPDGTHWLIPFQFALLCGCFALGSIGQRAAREMADHARAISHTDDLTGLPNRAGFNARSSAAFLDAVTRTGAPYSVLWFKVEDPARRPSATLEDRDQMLRQTANTIASAVADGYATGRTGELEFMVAVPRMGRQQALATARSIADRLAPLAAVQLGAAACPDDGATPEALARSASGLPSLSSREPLADAAVRRPAVLDRLPSGPPLSRTSRRLGTHR
ncbi:MAG: diguanylate cyclase, partial [Solirubrobacteraceae bacterium]|nr:diguanylate cyclase [Solirubrobacteraceae bacterium]